MEIPSGVWVYKMLKRGSCADSIRKPRHVALYHVVLRRETKCFVKVTEHLQISGQNGQILLERLVLQTLGAHPQNASSAHTRQFP